MRQVHFLIACICALPLFAAAQTADKDYPKHPIKMVVPYVAGGPMDYIGRTLGNKIAATLGQNFVIDNRAGAGGAIGSGYVAKSAPDGYTILNTSSSHASLPVVSKSLPYDPISEFVPITLVANSAGFLMAVSTKVTATNVQEFIKDAKANPGKYNYGSAGVGNVMHFAAEFFSASADIKMTHVPYKGVGEAMNDLIAGRIDVCFGPATALAPMVKSGRIKVLAITGQSRWPVLPNVPTVDEAGLKGFFYTPWYGFWFPAGTPNEYVKRIRNEVAKALDDPEIKRSFSDQGFVTVGSTPEQFDKIIREEIDRNKILAAKINLAPQ